MNNFFCHHRFKSKPLSLLFLFCSVALFPSSCATPKVGGVIDRTAVPEVRANVPVNESEIREFKFDQLAREGGHRDLHITGQLFTKSSEAGTTQIKPCSGCVVMLHNPADTSEHVNMTTESDGYFSFHGANHPYSLSLRNPGHNRVEINAIPFESEGATIIKIINAKGNALERFVVTKTGKEYTWSKVQ